MSIQSEAENLVRVYDSPLIGVNLYDFSLQVLGETIGCHDSLLTQLRSYHRRVLGFRLRSETKYKECNKWLVKGLRTYAL